YLSDHRPILLRDAHVDYGLTPFRFFFIIGLRWRVLLKWWKVGEEIVRVTGNSNRDAKAQLKLELEVVDSCIDNGNGTVEDIKRRGEIVNKLQDIDKLHALETAQKAKVKWAVEGSIPIFHMSMYRVPMGVLRTLESLRSYFFNGYDPNSRLVSWVKWKMVLASKDRGGLGVSSLYALNRGLLFKWLWRFYSKDSSLWSKVIMAIHGSDGKVEGIDLKKFMRFKVGNGENIMFWEDTWNERV
nr:RNA-directed DNA polymerase, eukaryota, reverse transcriptase zinc-binding domain protein [Tanacetum cinerariifolium]